MCKISLVRTSLPLAHAGGINLKHSRGGVDASNLVAIRFWVKGDATANGPGDPTLQLRVNSAKYEFEITNGVWNIYQMPLSLFGSPSTIEVLVIQNRRGSDLLVYVDQIELLAIEPHQPTIPPTTPTLSSSPSKNPVTNNPTPLPTSFPTREPSTSGVSYGWKLDTEIIFYEVYRFVDFII